MLLHLSSKEILIAIVTIFAGCFFFHRQSQSQENIDEVKRIIAVWKKRTAAIKMLSAEWTESTLYRPGSLPTSPGSQKALPVREVRVEYTMKLLLRAGKLRFSRKGLFWDATEGRFLPNVFVHVFDEKDSKDFFDNPKGESAKYRSGFVHSKARPDITNYRIWPLLFFARPMHAEMGYFKGKLWKYIGTSEINGRRCNVLEYVVRGIKETCWVDHERDLVLRYTKKGTNLIIQTDIEYKAHQIMRWVPDRWTWQHLYSDLTPAISSSAKILKIDLNPKLPADVFRFSFPPGTLVTDSKNRDPNGKSTQYVVVEGNTKQIVTHQDRMQAKSRTELVQNITTRAAKFSTRLILFIVFAFLAIGGGSFWFIRRYRIKRKRLSAAHSND